MIPHDARVGAVADVLEGLQQHRVCHIPAEVANKDVKMRACVLALLFLEGPLDAHFLGREAAAEKGPFETERRAGRLEPSGSEVGPSTASAAAMPQQAQWE